MMAEETLDDSQVISILSKMDVEQRTLSGLWGQFSVAVRQAGAVVARFQEVSKALPTLERERTGLEEDIAACAVKLEQRKRQSGEEEMAFKEALKAELEPLRKKVTQERERAAQAVKDADNAERVTAQRKEVLAAEVKACEQQLVDARVNFEEFKVKCGLC